MQLKILKRIPRHKSYKIIKISEKSIYALRHDQKKYRHKH